MKYKNKIQTARKKYLERLPLSDREQILIEKDFSGKDFLFFSSDDRHFILPDEYNKDATYTLIEKQIKGSNSVVRRPFIRYVSSAVAILIIALLSTIVYNYMTQTPATLYVSTTYGEKKVVNLPDGSVIELNSLSSISYPKEMNGDTRSVTLKGEAYFDVAKNPNKAFIVNAGGVEVKVLGTKFNINAYENQETITTSLFEGLVSVGTNSRDINILKPGEQAVFDKRTKQFETEKLTHQETLIAWRYKLFIFDNETLSDILKVISREKDVVFDIEGDTLKQLRITLSFDSKDSLDDILKILGQTAQFTYTKKGNTYKIKSRQ